ncbi:MAG: hypothetical protein K2X74_23640 [Acetobacteraceae bacterium]|nr:hypothetical protein [Acetobacteraceae bacterium]
MISLRGVDALAERGHPATFRGAHSLVSARRALLGLPLLLAAGCETDPVGNHLWGFGDPVRGAALYAPRNLGDTSRWVGQPAGAALAAAQLEFLAAELRTSPRYAPAVDPGVVNQLDLARAEMRQFLGIAPEVPPQRVITALRSTAEALRAGNRDLAVRLLSAPEFTAGPLVTLARLEAMPRLPRTAAAANLVANEITRLGNRRV